MMNWGDPRLPDHFWAQCVPIPECGCWFMTGRQVHGGYTQISINGKRVVAHRVPWETLFGPLPPFKPDQEGRLELDHVKCNTPWCSNPAHVDLVTHAENTLRGVSIPARNALKTHCLRGHPFTVENTLIAVRANGKTQRVCRECRRNRKA